MKYIWQFLNCLKFLFVLFVFKGCEQKPLILDVGENGLQLGGKVFISLLKALQITSKVLKEKI